MRAQISPTVFNQLCAASNITTTSEAIGLKSILETLGVVYIDPSIPEQRSELPQLGINELSVLYILYMKSASRIPKFQLGLFEIVQLVPFEHFLPLLLKNFFRQNPEDEEMIDLVPFRVKPTPVRVNYNGIMTQLQANTATIVTPAVLVEEKPTSNSESDSLLPYINNVNLLTYLVNRQGQEQATRETYEPTDTKMKLS